MAKMRTIEDANEQKHENSRLTAISFAESVRYADGNPIRFVNCLCSCGKKITIRLSYLKSGTTLSCGCKKSEETIKRNTKYTINHRRLRGVYYGMISRCYDEKHPSYRIYGGKGVKVCDEWKKNLQTFLEWGIANGWQDGYDLDKDVLGDGFLYSPETCCFIPKSVNRHFQPKYKCKLNPEQVIEIYNSGDSGSELSRKYGVCLTSIFNIKYGVTHKRLTGAKNKEKNDRDNHTQQQPIP